MYTLFPVGSLLPRLVTVHRGADKIGLCKKSLVLRFPLIEKKAALSHKGKKSQFFLLFPNLEILCPIFTFILLLRISLTETISEQFWCELEKMCCIIRARLCLGVKMASLLKYNIYCWLCPQTFPLKNQHDHVKKGRLNQILNRFSFLTYARYMFSARVCFFFFLFFCFMMNTSCTFKFRAFFDSSHYDVVRRDKKCLLSPLTHSCCVIFDSITIICKYGLTSSVFIPWYGTFPIDSLSQLGSILFQLSGFYQLWLWW